MDYRQRKIAVWLSSKFAKARMSGEKIYCFAEGKLVQMYKFCFKPAAKEKVAKDEFKDYKPAPYQQIKTEIENHFKI